MRRRKRLLVLSLTLLVVALAVVLLLTFFVTYRTPGVSMEPTLPKGSRFIARKRPYADVSQVRRGDLVVYRQPEFGGDTVLYVYRVIGLPGDGVNVAGETVTVNGQRLPRQQVRTEGKRVIYRETNGDVSYEVAYDPDGPTARFPQDAALRVPPGHLFLLGDNRNFAADSRYRGTVPFDSVVAKKW